MAKNTCRHGAMPRRLSLLLFSIFLTLAAWAQKTVTGTVTDKGSPLAGATVTVKGTAVSTVTNTSGSFSIAVPSGSSVLVITYVGYQSTEVNVASVSQVSVSLTEQIITGETVIVTGYSSQRKKDITGAVAVVNVNDLKSQPTFDAQSQLQGRASGVTVIQNGVPGSGAQVRIRGLGSFNNNNPLYVVDGVQTGSISGLNPNDIESMQVLKDAASASVYGVRGSNGVIIVTTKKGKKKGVSVTYDMYYGSQNPGKGFDLLNAQEEGELYFLARQNSGLAVTGSVYGSGSSPVLPDYIYYSGAPNNGVPIMSGNAGVNPSFYSLNYNQLGDPGYTPYIIVPANKAGTNWYDEVTRNAPITNHNISVNGAGENSRYLLSLNYFNQQAISEYNFFKRYTARLNSEFSILDRVRIGENLQIFATESNRPANNDEGGIIAQTFRPMSIIPVYTIVPGDFAGTAGGSGFGTWGNAKNPLAVLYRNRNNRNNDMNIFGNVYMEIDLMKNLTFRSSFGGAINYNNSFTYPFIEYEHTENNANTTYSENFIRNNNWIWTNQASYKVSFKEHDLNVVVGTEAQKSGGRQVIGSSTGYYSYDYLPFLNLSNGSTQNLSGSVIYTPVTTQSYFAKADYSFGGKYLASLTVRRDGSSKFLDPNKWGTFPAFSLGWRISDEDFFGDVKWVDDLKIRGSWGKMGNEAALGASNAFTTFGSNRQSSWYDLTGTQSSPQEGFFLSFVGNALGKWEQSVTSNIGFDATLFNGTTDVIFDWYQKKTIDLLYNPAGQAIAGAVAANNPAFRNVGSMKNSGVDLMITNRKNINRDLRLISTLTFTTYKNEITGINGTQQFFDFNSPANEANRIGSNATRNFVGSPLNTYYGYQVVGLFQSASDVSASPTQAGAGPGRFKYADISGPAGKPDGVIDANDRTIIGDPNPDFTYGLNLAVEYKAFDVSAFFYGAAGKQSFNFVRWWTDFSSGFPGGRSKRALYDSWLPDGSRPNATTPIQEVTQTAGGFSTSGSVNSYYVENSGFFRLRNLQIGYTLPASLLSKVKISKARLYIQGTNLFTITKYTGLDPDIVSFDDRAAGVDVGAYPTVRQFIIGANINF